MNKIYLEYPAIISFETDPECYLVEFPDLPQCITEGESLEHAQKMAKEALSLCLDVLNIEKREFPKPSELKGDNIYFIKAELGKSTSYSEYHKRSYEKNRKKVLSKKRQKELELKKQGYKDFREMMPKVTLDKLKEITKAKNKNRRDLIAELINQEYEKIAR